MCKRERERERETKRDVYCASLYFLDYVFSSEISSYRISRYRKDIHLSRRTFYAYCILRTNQSILFSLNPFHVVQTKAPKHLRCEAIGIALYTIVGFNLKQPRDGVEVPVPWHA